MNYSGPGSMLQIEMFTAVRPMAQDDTRSLLCVRAQLNDKRLHSQTQCVLKYKIPKTSSMK